jgi:ABC-type multidrug transport system fused ATPase/permease subunit
MKAFFVLLAATWRYAKGRKLLFLLQVLMFVIANIILLLEPIAIGFLLNSIQSASTTPDPLKPMMNAFIFMVLIQVGFWLFHGPARVLENNTAFLARIQFKKHLFKIVTSLPVQWHKDHHSGQTISKISKATNALYEFSSNGWQFIEMIIRLVGSVIALFLLLPFAAAIAVGVSLIALVIVFIFDYYLLKSYEAINEKDHFVASALHDYITNIITVITLRLESLTQTELWQRMVQYFPMYKTNNIVNEAKWFLTTLIISIMTVVVLAWYAMDVIGSGGVLLAGTFFMLYEYLQKIGSSFYTFAWKYSGTIQQYADLLSANSILKAERSAESASLCLPKNWKKIKIENLRFSYEDEEKKRHHLKRIHLTLERGKKIALVGESGSGKSTLMSLIRGLHTTDEVQVLCDGIKLKKGLRCIASHVTLIPQEPEIFANTIEYNITVDTQQSKQDILEYVDLARFTSVLERLPKGLKTDIAEKGVNLSGGEKQRLALARGIFAAEESDIILLDEPTSSVDSQNELQIHKNIFSHFADRCIISSIHRLHLLPLFDEVYVLEKGEIAEFGKPEKLMNGTGILSKLWKTYNESRKDDEKGQR